jgi:hypothetical protein
MKLSNTKSEQRCEAACRLISLPFEYVINYVFRFGENILLLDCLGTSREIESSLLVDDHASRGPALPAKFIPRRLAGLIRATFSKPIDE